MNFFPEEGRKKRAQRAGVSVSELNPLKKVAAAMVKANCLYNSPVIPPTNAVGIKTSFGPACFGDVLFPADVHECIARHVPRALRTANRAVAQRRDRMTVWNAQVRFSHAAVRAKPRSAENSQSAESGQSGYDEGRNKSNGFVMACRRRGTFFARHAAERVPKRQSCGGKVEEREDHEQRVDIQAERV